MNSFGVFCGGVFCFFRSLGELGSVLLIFFLLAVC